MKRMKISNWEWEKWKLFCRKWAKQGKSWMKFHHIFEWEYHNVEYFISWIPILIIRRTTKWKLNNFSFQALMLILMSFFKSVLIVLGHSSSENKKCQRDEIKYPKKYCERQLHCSRITSHCILWVLSFHFPLASSHHLSPLVTVNSSLYYYGGKVKRKSLSWSFFQDNELFHN